MDSSFLLFLLTRKINIDDIQVLVSAFHCYVKTNERWMTEGLRGSWPHCPRSWAQKWTWVFNLPSHCPLLVQPGSLTHGMVPVTFREGLPPLVQPFPEAPLKTQQRHVCWVIANLVKLTLKISRHSIWVPPLSPGHHFMSPCFLRLLSSGKPGDWAYRDNRSPQLRECG